MEAVDSFASDLNHCVNQFRTHVSEGDKNLRLLHSRGVSASELVLARVRIVDEILQELWELLMPATEVSQSMCLVAVGGYGREELNPYSDIDVMILLGENPDSDTQQRIERFVRFMWDVGFEIGHSVRTLNDCVSQSRADITVMTNLLEARCCAGSQRLFIQMEQKLQNSKIWPAKKFFQAKFEEQKRRHHKFSDTAKNLEPNIKEGPGGLRDIHTIVWVTKRYFGTKSLHELVNRGFLQEDEYHILIEGRDYLWELRNALHFELGRRDDRLLFPHQLKLANNFGFVDDDANKGVEKLMKTFFGKIKELRHINQMLLQHFEETIVNRKNPKSKRLNDNFHMVDGFLDFSNPQTIQHSPEILLEACRFFQRSDSIRGVRASALRLMRSNKRRIDSRIRRKPAVSSVVREIFSDSHRLPETLGLMDDTGLLGSLIPEFRRVTGQLQYDLFHVYTVDAHLLNVVWNLHRLTLRETRKNFPLAAEAMSRIVKIERLYIACLFHDIAKGQGGDHSELGEEQTYRFCKRIGMDDYDAHLIAWLVRHHLAMSFTSQREDLNDSQVIARFAVRVGNQEHLDHLFLLTIADMRGTGPTVWNDWKGKMLEHLYLATSRMLLTDTLPHEEIEPRIEEIKRDTLAVFHRNSKLRRSAETFWKFCDDDYFLSYDAGTIAWHVEVSTSASAIDLPIVAFRTHPSIDVIQIFVLAPTSVDLLAIIAGAIDRCYLSVVESRVHPLSMGLTAFSFVVLNRGTKDAQSESNLRLYESEVRNSIMKRTVDHSPRTVTPDGVARHLSFPTRILFTDSPSNDYTIMEVTAQDRPGLLYLVVKTLLDYKVHVLSAKITTVGARAEDFFFLLDRDGNPLNDDSVRQKLVNAISQVLKPKLP